MARKRFIDHGGKVYHIAPGGNISNEFLTRSTALIPTAANSMQARASGILVSAGAVNITRDGLLFCLGRRSIGTDEDNFGLGVTADNLLG